MSGGSSTIFTARNNRVFRSSKASSPLPKRLIAIIIGGLVSTFFILSLALRGSAQGPTPTVTTVVNTLQGSRLRELDSSVWQALSDGSHEAAAKGGQQQGGAAAAAAAPAARSSSSSSSPFIPQTSTQLCADGAPIAEPSYFSKPVVSIVTPFYNVDPQQFKEAAQCMLRQTLTAWEWIVVVDVGSDNPASLQALEEVLQLSVRIRAIYTEQLLGEKAVGLTANAARARNMGMAQARSDYVLIIDGDDVMEPTTAEKWFWYLTTHPQASFVNSYIRGFGFHDYEWKRSVNPSVQFQEENPTSIHAMHRVKSLQQIGGYDEGRGRNGLEDWAMWLRYANAGLWGDTIPELLGWYRRREDHSDRWKSFTTDGIAQFKQGIHKEFQRLARPEGWPSVPRVTAPLLKVQPASLPISTGVWPSLPPSASGRRFVIIVPWLVLGGADKFNYVLVEGLIRKGWHCTIVTALPSQHSWHGAFRALTSDIIHLDHLAPETDFPIIVSSIVHSRQAEIVMVTNSFHGYAMLPYLKTAHPDVVFVDYNHMEEEGWREGGHPRYGAALQSSLDLSYTASQHLKDWMVERHADAGKIIVEYVGIELSQWQISAERRKGVRQALGLAMEDVVILYACRYVEQKQPLLAMQAIIKVLQRQQAAGERYSKFVLAGSGPQEQQMKSMLTGQLNKEQLACIVFLGPVPAARMHDLTLAADITFLPSVMEGIPTTFFEAMALGVVVVGARVGGTEELVDTGKTGFLVEYEGMLERSRSLTPLSIREPLFAVAAELYADHLHELSRNPQLRQRMAAASIERVQQFDVQITVDNMDRQLRELLQQKRKSKQQQGGEMQEQQQQQQQKDGPSSASSSSSSASSSSSSLSPSSSSSSSSLGLGAAAEVYRWALGMEYGAGAVLAHPR